MALGIYTDTVPSAQLSEDGTLTNPLAVKIDGRAGGSLEQRLFVRNDDSNFFYTTITLLPIDTEGTSIIDGTDGFVWKLSAGDTQPTQSQWDAIGNATTISLADIGMAGAGDTSTYLSLWLQVQVPRNASVKTYTDVQLQIAADQLTV